MRQIYKITDSRSKFGIHCKTCIIKLTGLKVTTPVINGLLLFFEYDNGLKSQLEYCGLTHIKRCEI